MYEWHPAPVACVGSLSLCCISSTTYLQHKTRTIQNLRPLGPVSGETLSQSEIDFYIDGVRATELCAQHIELYMLATHLR